MRPGAAFVRFGHCRGRHTAMTYVPGYDCSCLGTYVARTRCRCIGFLFNAARPEREDSKDSHWRQPLTSDSQAFVPEVTILHHPIGRATDIRTIQE